MQGPVTVPGTGRMSDQPLARSEIGAAPSALPWPPGGSVLWWKIWECGCQNTGGSHIFFADETCVRGTPCPCSCVVVFSAFVLDSGGCHAIDFPSMF